MATNKLAGKYYRCDLTQVKATNRGGRLHSAKYDAKDLANGTIGYLGGFVTGSTEVRTFQKPTAGLIANAMPVIVMKPEIMYDERLKQIGDFVNVAGKPFPVVPLENLDGFDLSADYFDMALKTGNVKTVAVGDMFKIKAEADDAGLQLEYIANATTAIAEPTFATQNACYFKVVGIKDSHVATYMLSDANGALSRFPAPYKMVALEVIKTTV